MCARTIQIYCTQRRRRPPPGCRSSTSTSYQAWPTTIDYSARNFSHQPTNVIKRSPWKCHFIPGNPDKSQSHPSPFSTTQPPPITIDSPVVSQDMVPKLYRVLCLPKMPFGPYICVHPPPYTVLLMIPMIPMTPYQGRERKSQREENLSLTI